MNLSEFERRDARGPIFLADFRTYARTARPTAIKLRMVVHVGKGHVSGGQPRPHSNKAGAGAPNFVTSYTPSHDMTQNSQILHSDQTLDIAPLR